MIIKQFLQLSIVLLSVYQCVSINTTVELVQILFRHGDRTPVMAYPSDPYNETTWAKYGGYGQLTQLGMQQHHNYGKYLRDRYAGFLDTFYNRNKVLVRSTDFDRTLMSAYSMLSGLFEPTDFQVWDKDIKWQPIAVHTTDVKTDQLFFEADCPKLNQLKKEVVASDEYVAVSAKYKKLLEVLDKNSGFNDITLIDLWKIGDVLFVEKTHNLTLPQWAEDNYQEIIESLQWGFYFDYRTTEMARLTSGPILNDMRANVIKKKSGKDQHQLFLYSAHDTYVAALTKLLNLTTFIDQPPYTSSVIMELRKSEDSQYFIQVYLKNNTNTEDIVFHEMTIYGCDTLCPYDKFLELTEPMMISDVATACKYSPLGSKWEFYVSAGVVGLLAVVFIITTIVSACRSSKQSEGVQRLL